MWRRAYELGSGRMKVENWTVWLLLRVWVFALWESSESLFPIRPWPSRQGGVERQEERKILRTFGEKDTGWEDLWALGHGMRCLQMACGIACPTYTTCSSMSAAQAHFLRSEGRDKGHESRNGNNSQPLTLSPKQTSRCFEPQDSGKLLSGNNLLCV